mgnify:CR=1 FL=1
MFSVYFQMKKIYFILGLLLLIVGVSPSYAKDSNPKKSYRKGKRFYKRSDYIKAAPFLKSAYNLDPTNAKYAYMLGKSVYEGDQPMEALEYFVAAYNIDQNIAPDINYYLARCMHYNLLFEEASVHYKADLQRLDPETRDYKETQLRIKQCESAPKVVKRVVKYDIENLGEFVNTSYPEYSSTFSDSYQYMIFTSRRPRKLRQMNKRRYHAEDINEEVYEAKFEDGKWMRTKLFIKPIPRWTHDASIKLSDDGKTLIYYVDNRNYGDVYVSKQADNGKWSKRESIGDNINTKEYNEPSVFITDNGQTLYWVSDKPGGHGDKDIYVSTLEGDVWSEGKNLGASINTPFDEDAPFISADGTKMYFSSRGHSSIGGYDLFVSEKQADGTWGTPENMGVPINSVGDDIYIVFKNEDEFFFSSDRPGGFGEKDIYFGKPSDPEDQPDATIVAGNVVDRETGEALASEVRLLDKETGELLGTVNTTTEDGSYRFVLPDCGIEYTLDVKVDPNGEAAIAGPVGKYNVISGRIIDAVRHNPLDAVVELIDAKTGDVVDQVPTNPETGNYMFPVESGRKYMLRVKSNEYLPYYEEFNVAPSGQIISHYEDIGLQKLTEANKLVITWQFFDTDKYLIKQDYIKDLENVVSVMNKVPTIKLNIIGHTDSDAETDYNQILSENRAKAVAKYLTDRGIDSNRLNISGMGEVMPIYPNDTPESKRWNRRVELYIIE